ncbi:hypothetical protein LLEC1_02089 [Akanthomyces lecanii]|uniref:MSP domain-containing protein n=1 Tax=Cordyceps confragosa TaxID=2714763 RepID=A0A179I8J6_CORDF|nr:hypothetical protein LLEC1_02089 [Akanthomyces lecanii]
MSIDVEPLELNFQRPFTVEVSQTLTIRNTSAAPLAFKLSTSLPTYCVRPNAGRIEPGSSFDVSVLLQAMKTEPAPDTKCRDKFLVQSAPITGDKEFTSIAEVLDNTDKNLKQERKIRVNWLPAHGEVDSSAAIVTPSKKLINGQDADTPDVSHNFSSPGAGAPPPYEDDASAVDADEKAPIDTPAALVGRAIPAVKEAGSETLEAVKAKLAAAQAEIAKLSDSGLRQRNVKSGQSEKVPAAELAQASKQSADGVSVQIVAILCLLSFLLAYFFF